MHVYELVRYMRKEEEDEGGEEEEEEEDAASLKASLSLCRALV